MKTKEITRTICFLCSFFLVLLWGAWASGQTIDTITITPTNPTPDDEIKIDIDGTKTNACYEKNTTTAGLDTCGVRLIINMTIRSGCMPFPNEPVGWDAPITARVDPLPAGNYTIAAELYEDGKLKDSMTTSFFVIDYTDITDVQIVQIRSSMLTNLHVDDPLTLMVDAIGPEETTILYKFYYRYGYGTPA